jgi:hypothetical protein
VRRRRERAAPEASKPRVPGLRIEQLMAHSYVDDRLYRHNL